MPRLVRLVGSGIGLAAEAIAARKASAPSPRPNDSSELNNRGIPMDPPPKYSEVEPIDRKGDGDDTKHPNEETEESEENDEEDWELDDAADEYSTSRGSERENQQQQLDVGQLTQSFLAEHPPTYSEATARLSCPVILPQRRPRDRSRGFVRAYAPALGDCGIDQATFLDFLETFYKASQASPIFNVINIAAVEVAVAVAKVTQTRSKTNNFLDQINERLFKPHGLFCLIITYKPGEKAASSPVNINQTIARSLASSGNRYKLGLSSGNTHGEIEMPAAAPLIFPALDAASEPQKQNALKKSTGFLADYYDRRAQAIYAAQNPNSSLAIPATKPFASRYSDPNHPAVNGSLISLVTGGYINPKGRRDQRRGLLGESLREGRQRLGSRSPSRSDEKVVGESSRTSSPSGIKGKRAARRRGEATGIRRILQQDILYLMIANLPSEEEMRAAERVLATHA